VDYDLVVVGSGPAGATTARIAAESGLKVLLVDKKQELGAPIQCSGAVSAHALGDVGVIPDDEFVSASIFGFKIYDSDGYSKTQDYRKLKPDEYKGKPLGYVVDRRRFDRYLMKVAEQAGAEVWLKTEALGYTKNPRGDVQLHLNRFGQDINIRTKVIIGADGLQSQVGKWAGLRTHIRLSELASCLQFVVDGVPTNGLLEIFTGHKWAPGGYAWIFSKGNDYAEVGLGVIRTLTKKDAKWHLDNFIHNSFIADRLKNIKILEVQGGGVPLTAPLKKQYANNIILVGDAARHVNPITGGGIHTALRCGVIAGKFLSELLKKDLQPTEQNLSVYQDRWMEELGESMWSLYRRKRDIFRLPIEERDKGLYETLSNYFHPDSEYRKI
jgi:digeranylgeranylglycerophospholipid reductase